MKTISIFISSPGDVAAERQIAGELLAGLQGKYWSFLRIDDVIREKKAIRATAPLSGRTNQSRPMRHRSRHPFEPNRETLLDERMEFEVAQKIWLRALKIIAAGFLRQSLPGF